MSSNNSRALDIFVAAIIFLSLFVVFAPILHVSPAIFINSLQNVRIQNALRLSLVTSMISATVATIISIPLAYYLAVRKGFISNFFGSLSLLYLGFPPVGLGVSLMILLRDYPGINILTEVLGLVFSVNSIVIAQTVIALPISIGIMRSVYLYLPRYIEELREIYGADILMSFRKIILPITLPGIISTWFIVWFRCFGEFGATIVLAGGTPLFTETLPVAIYNMISLADVGSASTLLIISSIVGLVAILLYSMTNRYMISRIERLTGIWG
jgi:molybdate transport system permease protein